MLHADSVGEDGLPMRVLDHPSERNVSRPDPNWPGDNSRIYVNPCDTGNAEDNKRHLAAVVKSCMDFGYTAGLQMHKYFNIS